MNADFQLLAARRHWRDVLLDWAPELAEKLGRSVDQIRDKGLTVRDFSIADSVEVRHPDGSFVHYNFAFALVRASEKRAAVFSEHDGYLEFTLIDDAVVAEIHERIYRHREE